MANARAYLINAHAHILVGMMNTREKVSKRKGTTCHKIFINKEASYGSVLDRVRDEMYIWDNRN